MVYRQPNNENEVALIGEVEIENLRRILDHKIETDEDYLDLSNLVEDESDENIS